MAAAAVATVVAPLKGGGTQPDFVEMASRARAVEAKLSDALHARLTERFVNRRTAILMKSLGQDAGMLPIELNDSGEVSVEGEVLGLVEGLRFKVDSSARHEDRRMLLAAAEKALPKLLGTKADQLVAADMEGVELARGSRLALVGVRDAIGTAHGLVDRNALVIGVRLAWGARRGKGRRGGRWQWRQWAGFAGERSEHEAQHGRVQCRRSAEISRAGCERADCGQDSPQ